MDPEFLIDMEPNVRTSRWPERSEVTVKDSDLEQHEVEAEIGFDDPQPPRDARHHRREAAIGNPPKFARGDEEKPLPAERYQRPAEHCVILHEDECLLINLAARSIGVQNTVKL